MSPDTPLSSRARHVAAWLLATLLLSSLSAAVSAQSTRGLAPSGVELSLSGPRTVVRGRDAHFRGTAYRVRGLATLEPLPRATLHARLRWGGVAEGEGGIVRGAVVDLRADADGRFLLTMPVPRDIAAHLTMEVEIEDGADARSFEFPLTDESPYALIARTDRVLYEAGEPVHVWTLVRDAQTQRPLSGEHVSISVINGSLAGSVAEITTTADGVASTTFPLPESAMEGYFQVDVRVGGETTQLGARVGTRTYSRLFATLRTEPELAEPGALVTAVVEVSTPSGAPVRDAAVTVTIDRQTEATGATDEHGVARIPFSAPSYMPGDTSRLFLRAQVHHPAHGEIDAVGALDLAVPLALSMTAQSRLGAGLVPEVDDAFYLLVTDGSGDPPAQSVEIEVEGIAVRGGRAVVHTDAAGIAEVPARLPAGTWAPGDEDGGGRTTSVLARIRGPLERTARLSLAVQSEAQLLPSVQRPIAAPGTRLEVTVQRRPAVQRSRLVAELLDGSEILAVEHLAPGETRTAFDLPPDRIGLLSVRVRALEGVDRAEGRGTVDTFLCLPLQLGFPTIAGDRPSYLVGETARFDVAAGAPPAGVRAFAAVMVRDLAAHDGEVPFRAFFLGRMLEREILAPSAAGVGLVRLALAAHGSTDEAGPDVPTLLDALGLPREEEYSGELGTDVLRDPFPWARELERRGVADVMRSVEEMLVEALANDSLAEITQGNGAQRRFRDDLLDGVETLGGGALTIAHLEAADPTFRYENVARRVARTRWIHLSSALARYLDPGDDASVSARMAAREPSDRWLPRMVERGLIDATDLRDPWGGRFVLVRTAHPSFALSTHAVGLELVSPGPDGRAGTADDVRDPFARVVPAGSPYAVASGEDELLRQLSLLSPFERAMAQLAEAYSRITAEITEEIIGDAVHAGVSEGVLGFAGIGTIGHGAGGGGGSGYGMGAGRMARSPSIRMGSASGSAFRGLARVMRERFPATLLFRPSVELDANGHADVEVRLADAVTTYIVETVMWRTDGWIWSAETRLSVDREIVVEAPIPEIARADDEIALPVRVGNRGRGARTLVVSVLESPELGIAAGELRTIEVRPSDATVTEFLVRPTREGRGHVRVAVATPEGEALDAVQLPLEVVRRSRRVRRTLQVLGVGEASTSFEVPADATARSGEIEVRVGEGLVAVPTSAIYARWAHLLGDPYVSSDPLEGSGIDLAFRVGARWDDPTVEDRNMSEAIDRLAQELDAASAEGNDASTRTARAARVLLGIAPALRAPERRDSGARLGELAGRARGIVAENAAQLTDDAQVLVQAAAALAWTARGEEPDTLATELARRVERSVVSVGDDVLVATPNDPLRASAMLALADARLGRPDRALATISTLARWTQGGAALPDELRAVVRVATAAIAAHAGRASHVVVAVDEAHTSHDAGDVLRLDLPALAAPGAHRLTLTLDGRALVSATATATYGVPWPTEAVRGPFVITLEGDVGVLDGTASLVLVVRNATPRTVAVPVIEVDLPTGAELTNASRNAAGVFGAQPPQRSGDVLTLTLTPMPPGAQRRIPLPFRWSVGGTLLGLGVAAYSVDRPDRATILPPRPVTIRARGAADEGAVAAEGASREGGAR